jgi:hypothetical protein
VEVNEQEVGFEMTAPDQHDAVKEFALALRHRRGAIEWQ